MNFLEALEVVKERLEGQEIMALQMDNVLMEAGFLTNFDVDVQCWLDNENVVYYFDDENLENAVQIFFKVTMKADENEILGASYIEITAIERF